MAFNQGIIRAFKEELKTEVIVPPHHEVMGAIGAAMLVHEEMKNQSRPSTFKGFNVSELEYRTSSFECKACPNLCEITQLSIDSKALARWGGRCDLWERTPTSEKTEVRTQ